MWEAPLLLLRSGLLFSVTDPSSPPPPPPPPPPFNDWLGDLADPAFGRAVFFCETGGRAFTVLAGVVLAINEPVNVLTAWKRMFLICETNQDTIFSEEESIIFAEKMQSERLVVCVLALKNSALLLCLEFVGFVGIVVGQLPELSRQQHALLHVLRRHKILRYFDAAMQVPHLDTEQKKNMIEFLR